MNSGNSYIFTKIINFVLLLDPDHEWFQEYYSDCFLKFSAAGRCELKIFNGNERSKYSNRVFNNSQVTISDCSIRVYF